MVVMSIFAVAGVNVRNVWSRTKGITVDLAKGLMDRRKAGRNRGQLGGKDHPKIGKRRLNQIQCKWYTTGQPSSNGNASGSESAPKRAITWVVKLNMARVCLQESLASLGWTRQ
ncbi:hypothetical protein RvY_12229 [Ramazzottius varieornatus]|uniref:Uncharacterized protein n=1 Tax=Ramazzottius varieornatus TaxID=947166 RepID=A0A1D1VN07_RAMVA|nr:hypothetical protein RvY_12229 [Ramazzottius varieornatus]